MKIGVTGTRSGMAERQAADATRFLINSFTDGSEFHHGDCVGVDVELAGIARAIGYRVVCHPPVKDELRGFFESDETRRPLPYFARNRNIVDETDVLMVVPYQDQRQDRGGTWYTYDYCVKTDKDLVVFYPGKRS